MKNSIGILENEIGRLQKLISINMQVGGSYPHQLEKEIAEHLTAIERLKEFDNRY